MVSSRALLQRHYKTVHLQVASYLIISIADPHHFHADPDPDPACHFDAAPDPIFHPDVDPDPDHTFQFDADPITHFFGPSSALN